MHEFILSARSGEMKHFACASEIFGPEISERFGDELLVPDSNPSNDVIRLRYSCGGVLWESQPLPLELAVKLFDFKPRNGGRISIAKDELQRVVIWGSNRWQSWAAEILLQWQPRYLFFGRLGGHASKELRQKAAELILEQWQSHTHRADVWDLVYLVKWAPDEQQKTAAEILIEYGQEHKWAIHRVFLCAQDGITEEWRARATDVLLSGNVRVDDLICVIGCGPAKNSEKALKMLLELKLSDDSLSFCLRYEPKEWVQKTKEGLALHGVAL